MLISATDIISQSWNLFKSNWRKLMPYMIVLALPSLVFGLLGVFGTRGLPFFFYQSGSNILLGGLLIGLLVLIAAIISIWAGMAMVKIVHSLLTGNDPGEWKGSFVSTRRLIWPAIYTSILETLAVMGGLILLIIPGIIFAIWLIFVFYIVIIEEKKGVAALRASKQLVAGRWWAILWRALLPGIVFGVAAIILETVVGLPLVYLQNINAAVPVVSVAQAILSSAVGSAIAPLAAAAIVTLYLSAKKTPIGNTPDAAAEPTPTK
jgi:hypothetical protein